MGSVAENDGAARVRRSWIRLRVECVNLLNLETHADNRAAAVVFAVGRVSGRDDCAVGELV